MKKRNRDITILVVGDKGDFDSYEKLHKEYKSFIRNGFSYVSTSYAHALKGQFPRIDTERIIVFLYFPFKYWDKNIEHKKYRGLYGNHTFYKKFVGFWGKLNRSLRRRYADKDIFFINSPELCAEYRNKEKVIKKLEYHKVPQPRIFDITSVQKMREKLNQGYEFYLKPKCGSMGKGITFLSRSNWKTNFQYKNNKIISMKSDYGWKFSDITGEEKFLEKLLKKDIIIQEAIESPVLDEDRVDLRIYVFFGEIIYIYPRRNSHDKVTTNISQGGRGAPDLLEILPDGVIEKAKKAAIKTSKALEINLLGIDVVLDRKMKNVYVIDVNVFPGFPKRKTFNLARHMAGTLGQMHDRGKIFY